MKASISAARSCSSFTTYQLICPLPSARRIFRVGNELNERWLRDRGVVVIPWSTGDSLEHVMRRVVSNLGRQRQTA